MVTGVTLKGICKSFQSRGRVVSPLKDFSLNLEPWKVDGRVRKKRLWKNNAIKSDLRLGRTRCRGDLLFDEAGRPVSSPKLSLVFQDPRLLPWKTVEENLSLAIRHLPEEELQAKN